MATNVSKLDLTGHSGLTDVSNYISQINVGDVIYDIATHHGIKFKNGSSDASPITWKGLTDIEVIIPSLEDLVTDPVKFAGTVGANGTPVDDKNNTISPVKGDLVFITAVCEFPASGSYCEAGDMAVYDGSNWKVISGENQVSITGIGTDSSKTFTLTATSASVLNVEGKSLSLAVDYTGVKDVMSVGKNANVELSVEGATITVTSMYVALSKGDDSEKTIAVEKSIDLPTALANSAVTINEKVLVSDNFTFESGSLPAASLNTSAIELSVSSSLSVGKVNTTAGSTGDFVATIDGAVKSVSIIAGDSSSNDIAYISDVSLLDDTNKVYISRMRTATSKENAELVVPGKVTISNGEFVCGLGDAAASGEVVSSITVGAVTSNSTDAWYVTGLSTAVAGDSKDVITKVSFGSVTSNASSWFVTGLSSGTEVVTGVSVGNTTLASDATSSFKKAAFVSATVSNNVLSFSTADFMTPVSIIQPSVSVDKTTLTKGGVELTGYGVSSADFIKGGFTQESTLISYRDLVKDTVTLAREDDGKYVFDTAAVPALGKTIAYAKISAPAAEIKYNSYQLNGGVSAYISASKVLTGFDAGSLPSLTIATASGDLTGSVETTLTSSSVSWYAVDTAASKITIPGTYTLVSDSSVAGAIEVGAAGDYSADAATVTISSDTFVTEVYVSGTSISKA